MSWKLVLALAITSCLLGVAVMAWAGERQARRTLAAADSVASATGRRADSLRAELATQGAETVRLERARDSVAAVARARGVAAGAATRTARQLRDSLQRVLGQADSVAVLVQVAAALDTALDSVTVAAQAWEAAYHSSAVAIAGLRGTVATQDSLQQTQTEQIAALRQQIRALAVPRCSILGVRCPSRWVALGVGLVIGVAVAN